MAVLLQEFEGEGRLPIAHASKKLLPREKELLRDRERMFGVLQSFASRILGVEFLLETDTSPCPTCRQLRFSIPESCDGR